MADPTSLRLIAGLEHLGRMRAYLSEQAAAYHVEDDVLYDLNLAVTELVTNTLEYGYPNKAGWIELSVSRDGDSLIVTIRDRAAPFDPTRVPTPDLRRALVDRPLGGLGVHLVRKSVDEFTYRQTAEGWNEITLVKRGVIPAD